MPSIVGFDGVQLVYPRLQQKAQKRGYKFSCLFHNAFARPTCPYAEVYGYSFVDVTSLFAAIAHFRERPNSTARHEYT